MVLEPLELVYNFLPLALFGDPLFDISARRQTIKASAAPYEVSGERKYRVYLGGLYFDTDHRAAALLRQAVNGGYRQGFERGYRDGTNSRFGDSFDNRFDYGYRENGSLKVIGAVLDRILRIERH